MDKKIWKRRLTAQTSEDRNNGGNRRTERSKEENTCDLYDRKIVDWSFSDDMETVHTTIPAFDMAVKTRTPQTGLIFHSDRGVQYCAYAFQDALRLGCPSVRQSMSRTELVPPGIAETKTLAESFFKTLKAELETLTGKFSMAEVRQSVFIVKLVKYL